MTTPKRLPSFESLPNGAPAGILLAFCASPMNSDPSLRSTPDRPRKDLPVGEDESLAVSFKQGDKKALTGIYERYVKIVAHVFRAGIITATGTRIGANESVRSDLIQEVFVRAFSPSTMGNYDPGRAYRPYLLAIARHVLIDWHRKERRQRQLVARLCEFSLPPRSQPPTHAMAIDESTGAAATVIATYVRHLPASSREIYEYRVVQGRSQRQTATMLGLTRQVVRTLERRLHQDLRRVIATICTPDV